MSRETSRSEAMEEYKTPEEISASETKDKCRFCHTPASDPTSLYTCPKCSSRYCSLGCYRSKAHLNCAESFYKACVDEGLRTQIPDRKSNIVIDALRKDREEEDPMFGQSGSQSEEEEGGEDPNIPDNAYLHKVETDVEEALGENVEESMIEQMLSELGLGNASAEQLLSVLSPDEAASFQLLLSKKSDELVFDEEEECEEVDAPSCFRKKSASPPPAVQKKLRLC